MSLKCQVQYNIFIFKSTKRQVKTEKNAHLRAMKTGVVKITTHFFISLKRKKYVFGMLVSYKNKRKNVF
jgi:hypothetical protein